MKCQYCGKTNSRRNNYCRNCGIELEIPERNQEKAKKVVKCVLLSLAAIVVIPVIILCVISAFGYRTIPIRNGYYVYKDNESVMILQLNGTKNAYMTVLEYGTKKPSNTKPKFDYGAKFVMEISTAGYNHIFGNYYFTANPDSYIMSNTPMCLTTIRKDIYGDDRGYITFKAKSSVGIDFESGRTISVVSDAYDGTYDFDNLCMTVYIVIDGNKFMSQSEKDIKVLYKDYWKKLN